MLHALLVGVDAPRDPKIRPLQYAQADAEAVADALSRRIVAERQITLLVGERATKSRIARVLTEELPSRLKPSDTVLLYFAGHGSPEIDTPAPGGPSMHLIVQDTEQARLHSTGINVVSELAAWTRRLRARCVGLIFDSSFNGQRGGRSFEGPSLRSAPRTRVRERTSPGRIPMGAGMGVLSACADDQVATEDAACRHGVFTHHLLSALQSPDLGRLVSLATLEKGVRTAMIHATDIRQRPTLHGDACEQPLFHVEGASLTAPPLASPR